MSNETIRIRDIEGDAAQITNLCNNLGFDLNAYLNIKPTKPKISIWILGIVILLFIVTCCILWIIPINPALYKVLLIVTALFIGAIVFILHHNYDNWGLTGISLLTTVAIMAIALNIYTPKQVLQKTEDQVVKKLGNK
jgi:hypothetical protein